MDDKEVDTLASLFFDEVYEEVVIYFGNRHERRYVHIIHSNAAM